MCVLLVGCGGSAPSATRLPSPDPSTEESPGGLEILYVGDRDGTPGLFVIGADSGSNAVPLGDEPSPTTIADYAPSWSPDGKLIAHHRLTNDGS